MTLLEKYNEKCKKERPNYCVLDVKTDRLSNGNLLNTLLVKSLITGEEKWMRYGFLFRKSFMPFEKEVILKNKHFNFLQEVELKFGKDFTILGKFEKALKPILVKHNVCGREYTVTPNRFLKSNGCSFCVQEERDKNKRRTNEQFLKEVYEQVGEDYTFLEPYVNNKTKIKVRHNICEHEYYIKPETFLNLRVRCPLCASTSKGENFIYKELSKLNIKFEVQYKFDDCRNIKPLPFDFGIFNKEGKLIMLIEYQGDIHFKPCSFGSSNKEEVLLEFEKVKLRDKIKKEYCVANNIKLLEITYWEFKNIPTIINKIYSELYGDI